MLVRCSHCLILPNPNHETQERPMKTYVTPTNHERAEWSRLAIEAYRLGYTSEGTRFSTRAAVVHTMTVSEYDSLMRDYRAWLIDGFKSFGQEPDGCDEYAQLMDGQGING